MFPEYGGVRMDRRGFLKVGGAGLAGAVLLGPAVAVGGRAAARTKPSLDQLFDAAAERYGVPEELLKAMGYVNTMWEMPPPDATPYEPEDLHGRGDYGLMQLTENPAEDTLGRAADLTGLSEGEIKGKRAANVRAGAAVLSDLAGSKKPLDLNGWYEIVAEYGDGPLYANEVYTALQNGASRTISTGERVELSPQPEAETQAIPEPRIKADYGRARWFGNNGKNFSRRDRGSKIIDKIVIHVAQGTYSGTLDWFRHPKCQSSAHYTVAKKGAIGQSVREDDIAWHAGWWETNQHSIGIEHAGYIGNPAWFTRKMYHASARLTAYISKRYGVPLDRRHVISHAQVPGCSGPGGGISCHVDPGRHWNWERYMRLARRYKRRR